MVRRISEGRRIRRKKPAQHESIGSNTLCGHLIYTTRNAPNLHTAKIMELPLHPTTPALACKKSTSKQPNRPREKPRQPIAGHLTPTQWLQDFSVGTVLTMPAVVLKLWVW
jgi:hypothetical protein